MAKRSASEDAADNRANRLNPQHLAFHQIRASDEANSPEAAGSTTPTDDSAGSGK